MAIIAVLTGGIMGCVCALIGCFTLDLGFLSTLALWWSSGSLIAILFFIALMLPHTADAGPLANEQA